MFRTPLRPGDTPTRSTNYFCTDYTYTRIRAAAAGTALDAQGAYLRAYIYFEVYII